MIYVIIGNSGSGKTTFVVKNFLKKNAELINIDGVLFTKCGKTLLLGNYLETGRREIGADLLDFLLLKNYVRIIKKLYKKYNFVVEGDRINNNFFFQSIIKLKTKKILHLFITSLATVKKRLKNVNTKFVLSTRTKSINNFIKYRKYFDIVKTTEQF